MWRAEAVVATLVVGVLGAGLEGALAAGAAPPAAVTPCGEEQHEERLPWGRVFTSRFYPRQELPPRPQPAQVRTLSELEMMRQGYLALGWVEVTRFGEVRMNKPGAPPQERIPGPESAVAVAREQSARLGGDAFTAFRPEETATEVVMDPLPGGWGSVVGMRVGTQLRGTAWRLAPQESQAPLLVRAAQLGRGDLVQRLLRQRVPLDARAPVTCATPLIAAAQAGQADVIRLLLRAGAALEQTDALGITALGYAAFPAQVSRRGCEAAQVLRRAGAKEPKAPAGPHDFDFPAPARCPPRLAL